MAVELRYLAAIVARGTEVPADGSYLGIQATNVCQFAALDKAGAGRTYQFETEKAPSDRSCGVTVTVKDGVPHSSSDD